MHKTKTSQFYLNNEFTLVSRIFKLKRLFYKKVIKSRDVKSFPSTDILH
jgi:hypothetical protein